ncbi:MAG: 4-amino-4-deoxy-L-arabinose transferase [Bacteroidetes bacterium]|nr:MAG: 4-amino-4-deoxy-L-arabinose transferase [Bacteroidota bacterium]
MDNKLTKQIQGRKQFHTSNESVTFDVIEVLKEVFNLLCTMNQTTDRFFSFRNPVFIFTLAWFVVNIIQAAFTGLANDEAYYWMYARKLDIGYFDHPPMIALMIRAGSLLTDTELGLRLLTVVFSAISIPVLFQLSGKKDFRLFAFLFVAITVFQVYGFITVPDAPLILFTALFFLLYKKYLAQDGLKEVLLLSLVIALMLYSKYHGFLILFFTIISNLSLFRRKSFYAVVALSVLFYLPHIWWQIVNDYPSYKYHVLEKSQSEYNPLDTIGFIGGVLAVSGPLVSVLLIWALFKNKKQDPVHRAMRFAFFGFFVFFLLSTLNTIAEANWMSAVLIPLLVIGHDYISGKEKLRRWAIRLSFITALIFLFARINLVTDIVPAAGSKVIPEFYGWDSWATEVHRHAGGLPVVIENSYQRASKYSFYNKEEALSLNNIAYRRNQFDLWDIAAGMQGKKVALVMKSIPNHHFPVDSFETSHGKMYITTIDNFHSYTGIRIGTDTAWYHVAPGEDLTVSLRFFVPYEGPVNFNHDTLYPVSLVCTRYFFKEYDREIHLADMKNARISNGDTMQVHFRAPDKAGPYYIRFGLRSGWILPELNSRLIRMDVEK